MVTLVAAQELFIQTEPNAVVRVNGSSAQEVGVGVYRFELPTSMERNSVLEVFIESSGFIPVHRSIPNPVNQGQVNAAEINIPLTAATPNISRDKNAEWVSFVILIVLLVGAIFGAFVFARKQKMSSSNIAQETYDDKQISHKESNLVRPEKMPDPVSDMVATDIIEQKADEVSNTQKRVVSEEHKKYMPKNWDNEEVVEEPESSFFSLGDQKYRIAGHLAKGGVADLYIVENDNGEKMVLKQMSQFLDDNDMRSKFIGEGFAVNRINQLFPEAHIVKIYNYGQMKNADGREVPFILMEYIEGKNLSSIIKEKTLSFEDKVIIIIQLIGALEAVHSTGVLHRDIAPDNIMLLEGSEIKIKLIDFGVAKHDVAWLSGTSYGAIYGKPAYMSPEYLEGESDIDYRSDYYALGVLMYELFTGNLPFDDKNPYAIAEMHKTKEVPEIHSVDPMVTDMIYKLLSKKPEMRPKSLKILQKTLIKLL